MLVEQLCCLGLQGGRQQLHLKFSKLIQMQVTASHEVTPIQCETCRSLASAKNDLTGLLQFPAQTHRCSRRLIGVAFGECSAVDILAGLLLASDFTK